MARKLKRWVVIGIAALTLGLTAAPTVQVEAQCPMCRMSAESNLKSGGTAGRGLNRGILYLFVMPYPLVATFGVIWWRHREIPEEG